jgi:putative PEP-CTERM system integral membrane protein
LFWSWNVIFLAFMLLGFAPRLLPELLAGVRAGAIPLSYLIYGVILSLIPALSVILGFTLLRKTPERLFALGYVVEGPLMLLLIVRFFIIRQPTPASTFMMIVAGLGMAAFLWVALDRNPEKRGPVLGSLRLVGLTLMALTSLYAALWIAFYALPLTAGAIRWLGETLANLPSFFQNFTLDIRNLFREGLTLIFLTVLGFILVLYTATLFVLTPIAVPVLSLQAWRRSIQLLAERAGRLLPVLLVTLTVLVSAALFILTNRQPQKQVFSMLEKPPATPQEAQALLKRQDSIRTGLLNSYLAPFRYMSAQGEVRHVSDLYEGTFHMDRAQAYQVQRLYERVAQPLLYDPVLGPSFDLSGDNLAFQREPQRAARLYQRFFDETIVEGERPTIVNAVRSTWSSEQAEAAWQTVDEREVRLTHQEVTVSEHGDWAEVELYEVYQNETATRQEVVYYFNLPESAVLTGVWLGNSANRQIRFPFQVATRGAAQAVYRNETRASRDPALLEQIGPRQYRLRAFPIQPIQITWNDEQSRQVVEEAPPLHLWVTYRTLSTGEAWPLPRLALRRNVYWDGDSERLVNGAPMQADEEEWLPESVPVSQPVPPQVHRVDFPGGTSVLIQPAGQVSLPELTPGLRLAVVLDRSRSMEDRRDQVEAAFQRLEEITGPDAPVDVYLTASNFRGEVPSQVSLQDFNPGEVMYFGGQNAAELLTQFANLRGERAYDAVLVFTDGSGYELGASPSDVPVPDAPVWLVHLGSELPLGYDDQTLEAIQASGGGVAGDLDEALTRLAVALEGSDAEVTQRDVLDGYIWTVLPTDKSEDIAPQAELHSGEDGFIALAARRMILAEMQRQRGAIDELDTLDRLHALAVQYGIVTPYSSMIVLVNDTQQDLLEHLEQNPDRFNREFEELKNTTPATQNPLTGVPEPEEWILLSLAGLLLAWYANRQRLARQNSRF